MAKKAGSRSKPSTGRAKIDPLLKRALTRTPANALIEAVIMFRDRGGKAGARATSSAEKAVQALARTEPIEYNFFPSMGAVAVRTTTRALKKLLELPGVTTATVNELPSVSA